MRTHHNYSRQALVSTSGATAAARRAALSAIERRLAVKGKGKGKGPHVPRPLPPPSRGVERRLQQLVAAGLVDRLAMVAGRGVFPDDAYKLRGRGSSRKGKGKGR